MFACHPNSVIGWFGFAEHLFEVLSGTGQTEFNSQTTHYFWSFRHDVIIGQGHAGHRG
jgi:hypothetical protein